MTEQSLEASGRAAVTLTPREAVAARRMAVAMGITSLAEVVRRGLILLDLLLTLAADERLVVRNKMTGKLRLVLSPSVAANEWVTVDGESERATERAVITLSPGAAARTREMAKILGSTSLVDVVRQGLALLKIFLGLTKREQLAVQNTKTGGLESIRFAWDAF